MYTPYLSVFDSPVLVQGRGFRHDDHAWSPPQETRRRSIMDLSRLEIGSSCFMSCSVLLCHVMSMSCDVVRRGVVFCVLCCVVVWVIM